MQIEPGSTTPAQVMDPEGKHVLFAGTYTACAMFVESGVYGQVVKLQSRIKELEAQVNTLNKLRPYWAQGYSDDSVAAQVQTAAISDVWHALGVDNQTDCMFELGNLIAERKRLENA